MGVFQWAIDPNGFPTRRNCGWAWRESPSLGWMHVILNLVTWRSYHAILIALAFFIVKRKDVIFPRAFWLFCLFIFSSGTEHLLQAVIFWVSDYRLAVTFKMGTAIVSVLTVRSLIPAAPAALRLPSLAALSEELQSQIERAPRSELELQMAQAKLGGLLDNSRVILGILSPKGTLLEMNSTTPKAFGVCAL